MAKPFPASGIEIKNAAAFSQPFFLGHFPKSAADHLDLCPIISMGQTSDSDLGNYEIRKTQKN